MASGEGFTLEDFVEQLAMVRKLGPIGNLLGMLPGAAQNRELLSQVNDKDLDRAEAIVRSMTPEERRNPKIINGSRRARIANGSGVAVGEVSQLVTNFFEGQKQMKAMFGGGLPGMPPGMGAMARRAAAKQTRGKKGKKKPAPAATPAAPPKWPAAPAPRRPPGGSTASAAPRRASAEQAASAPCPRAFLRAWPMAWPTCLPAELPAAPAGQCPRRFPWRQQSAATRKSNPQPSAYSGDRARTVSMVSASAAGLSSR